MKDFTNEIIVSAVDANAKAHIATTGFFSQAPIKGVEEIYASTDKVADIAIKELEDVGFWIGGATRMDYDKENFTLLFLLINEDNDMKVVVYLQDSMRSALESMPKQIMVDYMVYEMRVCISEMVEESEDNPKDKYDEFRALMRTCLREH